MSNLWARKGLMDAASPSDTHGGTLDRASKAPEAKRVQNTQALL